MAGLDLLAEQMRAALAARDAEEVADALRAIARAYIAFGSEQPAHYLVAFGPRLNTDGRHPELESAIERSLGVVQRELEAAVERGELREHDSFPAALTLWSAPHGLTHLAVMERWNVRPAKIGEWGRQAIAPTIDGLLASLAIG